MKFIDIIFCEEVINIPTKDQNVQKNALVNPTVSFILQYIPGVFTFSVLVMLQGVPDENVTLKLQFKNPRTENTLFEAESNFTPSIQYNQASSKELAGFNINMQLSNVTLEDAGEYIFTVLLDDQQVGERTLYISKAN